ncbi:MAG: PilZ domain-containing protein [Sphingomicrobium sp.]
MEELPIEATVYSMSADLPRESDPRTGERHLTLFRVASIVTGERRELCLVKNISTGGALIRAYCSLEPETEVQVELKEGQPLAGNVTWVRGSDAGITFDEPVDVVELLKATSDGLRPRMPRIEVSCVGFVREEAILHRALLHNISQGGVSVEPANPLTVGADVTVSLPGLAPQGGVVSWNDGSRYGIRFNSVIPLAGLVEWLHSRQGA